MLSLLQDSFFELSITIKNINKPAAYSPKLHFIYFIIERDINQCQLPEAMSEGKTIEFKVQNLRMLDYRRFYHAVLGFQYSKKYAIPAFSHNPNDNLDISFTTRSCANHENKKTEKIDESYRQGALFVILAKMQNNRQQLPYCEPSEIMHHRFDNPSIVTTKIIKWMK